MKSRCNATKSALPEEKKTRLLKSKYVMVAIKVHCTTTYRSVQAVYTGLIGTSTGGTSVRSYVPCIDMLGMTRYSSIHTIPTIDRYIGTDQ